MAGRLRPRLTLDPFWKAVVAGRAAMRKTPREHWIEWNTPAGWFIVVLVLTAVVKTFACEPSPEDYHPGNQWDYR